MNTQPELWAWQPLRIEGQNVIGVFRGRRLVTVFSAHEVDDAHALCQVRNLAGGVIGARYRLPRNNGQ